ERELGPRLESWVLQRAAHVLTNSRGFAAALSSAHPALPVTCIPNGFDATRVPHPRPEAFPGLSLAYMGTLYFGRDFGPVLEAFARFLARNPAAAAGSRLRIAGHMDQPHRERFRVQLVQAGLESHVELLGVLPPADALRMLDASSLSVV